MKIKLLCLFVALIGLMGTENNECKAVNVTLTIDEGAERPVGITAAERNLGKILTEINK